MRFYSILKDGRTIDSTIPGRYAGWKPGKIFGRLDCKSGMRMKKENRVFFLTLEDAVNQGYRPCKNCRPVGEEDFEQVKHLIPEYNTLNDFYNKDRKLR